MNIAKKIFVPWRWLVTFFPYLVFHIIYLSQLYCKQETLIIFWFWHSDIGKIFQCSGLIFCLYIHFMLWRWERLVFLKPHKVLPMLHNPENYMLYINCCGNLRFCMKVCCWYLYSSSCHCVCSTDSQFDMICVCLQRERWGGWSGKSWW
jgi:hypothetical protein